MSLQEQTAHHLLLFGIIIYYVKWICICIHLKITRLIQSSAEWGRVDVRRAHRKSNSLGLFKMLLFETFQGLLDVISIHFQLLV